MGAKSWGIIPRTSFLAPKLLRFSTPCRGDLTRIIRSRMPVPLDQLNELIDDLTPAEQSQLADLLQKLYCSPWAHGKVADPALEQGRVHSPQSTQSEPRHPLCHAESL